MSIIGSRLRVIHPLMAARPPQYPLKGSHQFNRVSAPQLIEPKVGTRLSIEGEHKVIGGDSPLVAGMMRTFRNASLYA